MSRRQAFGIVLSVVSQGRQSGYHAQRLKLPKDPEPFNAPFFSRPIGANHAVPCGVARSGIPEGV